MPTIPEQRAAVQRAEHFYRPPPRLPSTAWEHVPAAERVWSWYEHQAQRRMTMPSGFLLGESVQARINHNRWVADCVCGSAQVVTPDDARFACPECLWGWVPVIFPVAPDRVEEQLAALPPHDRNWWQPDDNSRDRPAPRQPRDKTGRSR